MESGDDGMSHPLFIVSDMVSPTVSFRSHDIHEVYHQLQMALEQVGHLRHFRLRNRGEENITGGCRGLDGYSFFGLNLKYVVNTLEMQENSLYHAIPPYGFIAYNYHEFSPKSEAIIRVNSERVSDCLMIQCSGKKKRERVSQEQMLEIIPMKWILVIVLIAVDVFLLKQK